MPRINLLPWREQARAQRQQAFIVKLVMVFGLSMVTVAYGYWHNTGQIKQQQARNHYLQQEIVKATEQVKMIEELEKTQHEWIARMQAIASLQTKRMQLVHLFDQLVHTLPDTVYLSEVMQQGEQITVLGFAQSNASISAYMQNIQASQWLGLPQLQIIEQKEAQNTQGVRHFKLTMPQSIPAREGQNALVQASPN